jgi:hypothetical protein
VILYARAEGITLPDWSTDPASGLLQARLLVDKTGIEPDRIAYNLTTYTGTTPEVELLRLLSAADVGSPGARLTRLRHHPQLADRAERVAQRLSKNGEADAITLLEIVKLEAAAYRMQAAVPLRRDRKLQVSKGKPRGSKHPLLDAWLDAQLRDRPDAMNDWLWGEIPTASSLDLFRDGSEVCVKDSWLQRAGFDKRVTEARKRAGIGKRKPPRQ